MKKTPCVVTGCPNPVEPGNLRCNTCIATGRHNGLAKTTKTEEPKLEKSGGDVNYYIVDVPNPKRLAPYKVEVGDLIEVLEMNFAEGTLLKALIRSCNLRVHGIGKEGEDADGVYDGDKIAYYGGRVKVQRRRKAGKEQ